MNHFLARTIGILLLMAGLVASGELPAISEVEAPNTAPVVLELFTSQGCSSCPPADQLAANLVRNPRFLVLTRPVTYWDRLGWKDTLAREENTALQRAYSHWLGGGGRVYTPQMVIGGMEQTVGSREDEIRDLARRSWRRGKAELAVHPAPDGGFGIGLAGKTDAPAELVLVAIDSSESVAIGRGENSGRRITYTNVVRDERVLGKWNGGPQAFPLPATMLDTPDTDRYALLLREPNGGPILAAAKLKAG